ncbi:MAG: hypothetical protein U0610_21850 [bacterium]
MSPTFWITQIAFDTLLIGGFVWMLYEGRRLRRLAANVRGSAHGTAALAEIVDDLEALTRASALTAREIEQSVKANGEEIQRRLLLVEQKRDELERAIDRAEELAARVAEPVAASAAASASSAPRAGAHAGGPALASLVDPAAPTYDLACDLLLGGLDPDDVARDTRLPIAEVEVLRALRLASTAPITRASLR